MEGGKGKTQLTCYLCETTKNLLEYDEENGICQKCYDEQQKECAYYKSIKTNFYPEIEQIEPGLYLGNEDAAINEDLLKERNITAICACGRGLLTPFLEKPGYEYLHLQVNDFPKQNLIQYFPQQQAWMDQMRAQGRTILIHCAAGISRSATFTIAYIMKREGMGFDSALAYVRKGRKSVHPNSGFREQLRAFEK